MISNGTGRPNNQPATNICFRPSRSENRPANKFASALTIPKLTIKERVSDLDVSPKSALAISGTTVRSKPTIAPTNALTMTSSVNCCQFASRPSRGESALGDRTIIPSSFQLGGILDQIPRFIEFDDVLMIGGHWWDST